MNTNLRVAVVCSSNQNRSMEAHAFLSKKGFKVRSFGSGNQVKLPGPAPDKPNVYDFNISYEQMYQDLLSKDKALYTQNGLLHMLDQRVYDQVVEELSSRSPREITPVHIINIDVQDNHEEATIGAFLICEMATMMAESEDLDNDIDELLQEFEAKARRPILHTVLFF
ncbi:RNA polymerase II subunit A C-terminal domain phosphatase SSU72 [Trichonephila clavipes]|nr:RNA polymerase II subunit A C-terminal domain phosphatase SSU72 [Trichonephila clavipes]